MPAFARAASPLRQRTLDDMRMRKLAGKIQSTYMRLQPLVTESFRATLIKRPFQIDPLLDWRSSENCAFLAR